jgi:fructosamine-3-kinase
MWTEIAQAISRETEQEFAIANTKSVSGGCINQGYRVSSKDRTYFVKLNDVSKVEMFAAEALGLKQIYATKTITVPQPVCWGIAANYSYLVLQWLDLGGGSNQSWTEMGRQLAAMHRVGTSKDFGWERNNTIGSTPQINTWMDNWADFFAEQRIGYQLKLAKRRGGNFPESNRVVDLVRNKLTEWQPQASLVHGDLWSGNAAMSSDGTPIILDPATYYGDRETDLAMTELFGGFPTAFYHGYNEAWSLDSGYGQRKSIYNLYHVLNHFNLFGGGYANQAQTIIQRLIS